MAMSIIPQSSLPVVLNGVYIRQDEVGRFRMNDLHIAAGGEKRHQPSNWLRLPQVQELVQCLSQESDAPHRRGAKQNQPLSVVYNGGSQEQGTYVCKELVYSYAMWVKPEFHIEVVRTYDQVVQHGFEQIIASYARLSVGFTQLVASDSELRFAVWFWR